MKKLFAVFLTIIFFSCKQDNKVPGSIIEPVRMQELMWDLFRADAFITNFRGKPGDTAFNQLKESVLLYRQVFEIHKTNKEEFKKSLTWYQLHPVVMKRITDTLQGRQNKIMQERSKPAIIPPTDTLKS
jgi:Domain of unknown function (DUF4296)